MERFYFSDLIGAERGGMRWGRPMIFFAALFLADFLSGLLFVFFKNYIWQDKTDPTSVNFSYMPNLIYFASDVIINNLILAILLMLIFYLIKNELISIIVVTVFYSLITLVNALITERINLFSLSGSFSYGSGYASEYPYMRILVVSALYVFFVIGSMVLAAYLIKLTWLALPIGALAGSFAFRLSLGGYYFLTDDKFEFKLKEAIPFFITSVILGVVFWFGTWITADNPRLPEGEKPRLSKEFYAGTWASTLLTGCISMSIATLFIIQYSPKKWELIAPLFLFVLALLLIIYGSIVFMILIYKMWAAIQDNYTLITPGQAVGYLFIPIYSLYWMFQALPGFAREYNDYTARNNLNVRPLSSGVFTAYCALILLSILPAVGILLALANFFVGTAMMCKACDAVNALPTVFERPQPPPFPQYG